MNKIIVQHYFDSAHKLEDSDDLVTKACARLHGHTYAVKITVSADKLNNAGMVVDFKAIKQLVDVLDHRYINDVFSERGINLQPTAENIAVFLCEAIESELKLTVERVEVCEGYKGIERASWAVYEPQS